MWFFYFILFEFFRGKERIFLPALLPSAIPSFWPLPVCYKCPIVRARCWLWTFKLCVSLVDLNQGKKISCKCMAWVAAGEAIYPFPGVNREPGNWNWSSALCPGDITSVSPAHVVLNQFSPVALTSAVWAVAGACSRGNSAFWVCRGGLGCTGGCVGSLPRRALCCPWLRRKILLSYENLLKCNFFLLPLVLV